MPEYNFEYFNDGIFATDYIFLANAIAQSYAPKSVIEVGCGPGHLSKALSNLSIKVDAIDGFAEPDFHDFPNITFSYIDLNNEKQFLNFIGEKQYDLAICTEVAEHLDPSSSSFLIKCLTKCAPVVIFSAAVPGQGGHGHINCKSRGFWHNMFVSHDFQLVDSLRSKLRENENLALWYKLNVVDYISNKKETVDLEITVKNLLESESYSSSLFYKTSTLNGKNEAYLNYPLIKQYLQLRAILKKALKG